MGSEDHVRSKPGSSFVTTLEEDLKQEPMCQDSSKDVLSDSDLENELTIPFATLKIVFNSLSLYLFQRIEEEEIYKNILLSLIAVAIYPLGRDKLDLTRFFGYKFRSASAKRAWRLGDSSL
ncbi:hypothetical protein TNCV_2303851 [Trichonephila clavipes]|nr:hypothetical protein TNCV_2303851 [Trichonephila clavipes]